ncbi:CDP-diacylglycerol--glycerol-3-phosphate 3-phosphatidyltransferase [Anaplasmataceae bacterium AB001_6]|nr:CDP-diacylglycerol--glycerol-3-phosphate 3-phosphatidyltransferase [Anaplasmataceae bacterium AB001_6]
MKIIPNFLTTIRLFSIVVIIIISYFASAENIAWYVLLVFTFASLTDFFDGYIARFFNVQSDFGKLFDPIADKVLTSVMFLLFISNGIINGIDVLAVMLIFVRELMVTGLREFANNKKIDITVSFLGKIKTFMQFMLIVVILLSGAKFIPDIFNQTLLWIVSIITVTSGFNYYYRFYNKNLHDSKNCELS